MKKITAYIIALVIIIMLLLFVTKLQAEKTRLAPEREDTKEVYESLKGEEKILPVTEEETKEKREDETVIIGLIEYFEGLVDGSKK